MILVAKGLGVFLKRKDDYYGDLEEERSSNLKTKFTDTGALEKILGPSCADFSADVSA